MDHQTTGTSRPSIDRRTFLAASAAGLAGLSGVIAACGAETDPAETDDATTFEGRIIIIGAGPAGMTAAYLLKRRGITAEILEATGSHGGRIRHNLDFVDFPVSLGAEWLHDGPSTLDDIVDDPSVTVSTGLIAYSADDSIGVVDNNGELEAFPMEGEFADSDLKFEGSSWLEFFDTYIVPDISDQMVFRTPITVVDYSGDGVVLTDASGATHTADRVIVTVPLAVLQRGDVRFEPPLPSDHTDAIERAHVWNGLKAFIEFDEAFYPTVLAFDDSYTDDGQRLFYDAAFGHDTDVNLLGLFSVGAQAEYYQSLSDGDFIDDVLAELDSVFDGAASQHCVRHLVQNWNDEPFAAGAYLEDEAPSSISRQLSRSIDGRVFFAGDAYTRFDNWSSVDTAARSARDAVDELLS